MKKDIFKLNKHSEICLSASATVEAALVMPLFIYAVVAIVYMLQILMVKQDMSRAAYNSVRTMSKYAYAYDKLTESDKEVSAITAYATLLSELGTDYAKEHYIVGGNAGIVLLGTNVLGQSGAIDITITYSVKNPFDIFGIGIVSISQEFSAQGWLGDNGVSQAIFQEVDEQQVYITLYGEVYHTSEDCAYLNLSISEVLFSQVSSMRNYSGAKYYPCEDCIGAGSDNTQIVPASVYVTSYGNRYHQSLGCSGLKRTVIKVPLSKVEDRRVCVKCKGNGV